MRGRGGAAVLLVMVSVAHTGVVWAQDSRAADIAAAQAEKAQRLQPYTPSKAELILGGIEKLQTDPPPVAPYFDSVYSGGGFTLGAQYRKRAGDRALWALRGLYSFSNYKLIELVAESPGHANDRLTLGAKLGWRDATQVGYFGLGPETVHDDRANYRFKETYAGGIATFRVARWLPVEGALFYDRYDLEPGKGSAPSIETVYTPADAPGLGDSATFVHSQVRAGFDSRTSPEYTRVGGYYGVAYDNFADTHDVYSFDRVEVEAVQHLPILRENWVLSVRGRVQSTIGHDVVPYYLYPSIGGGRTLRAFSSWRFRDRNALIGNVEWRWIPSRLAIDMALFYDAGTVADDFTDLDDAPVHSNWGVGVRLHSRVRTVLRVELARGGEGWNLVFASSAPF